MSIMSGQFRLVMPDSHKKSAGAGMQVVHVTVMPGLSEIYQHITHATRHAAFARETLLVQARQPCL